MTRSAEYPMSIMHYFTEVMTECPKPVKTHGQMNLSMQKGGGQEALSSPMREAVSVFWRSADPGILTILPWSAIYPRIHGQHKLDLIFLKKEHKVMYVGLDLGGAMGEDDESPMYGILKDKVKKKKLL